MRIRLSFIETSGGQEKGKAGRPRVRNSCVRAYACPGILGTQSSSNKQEREKGETPAVIARRKDWFARNESTRISIVSRTNSSGAYYLNCILPHARDKELL